MSHDDQFEKEEELLTMELARGDSAALHELLSKFPAPDLAELFPDLEESAQATLIIALDDEAMAELLAELDPTDQEIVLSLLSTSRTQDIIEEMYSDDVADLLSELPEEHAEALIERMEQDTAEDVAELLRYDEDSAGGLMAKEYVTVTPEQTVVETLAMLRQHHDDAEMIYELYVTSEDELLLGIVSLHVLIVSPATAEMADIMNHEFVSVPVDKPGDEVADLVRRHDLLAVPVLDSAGRIVGIITVDDIIEVAQETAGDELLEISGAEVSEEDDDDEPRTEWRNLRGGLLVLGGALLAALLVWLFMRAFAVWDNRFIMLPMVMVMALTVASQAALTIDQLFAGPLVRRQSAPVIYREAATGLIMACVGGLMAVLVLYIITRNSAGCISAFINTALSLLIAEISAAGGALLIKQRGGRLGSVAHSLLVMISLLLAITLYLGLVHTFAGF